MNAAEIEEMWQILRDTEKIVKDNAARMAEAQNAMAEKEEEAKRKEEEAKKEAMRKEEWDRGMAELRAAQQETDRQLKELRVEIFGDCDKVVDTPYEYFQTALAKDFKFGGIQFDDMLSNLRKIRRGKSCEFDIVLVNHSAVGIIDAKHRVHNTLPEVMATRKAAEFRSFFPEYNNHKLYLGVAGFSIDKAAIPEAEKYGVGILKQDGDAVKAVDIKLKEY